MKDIMERSRHYRRIDAICARGHYLAAAQAQRFNRWLGIPAAMTAAVIGLTALATLQLNPGMGWRIAAGLALLLAAVLSTLQTQFDFGNIAAKHKTAGAKYSAMQRRLEVYELKYAADGADRAAALFELEALVAASEALAEDAPARPDKLWDQAKQEQELDKPGGKALPPAPSTLAKAVTNLDFYKA